MNFIVDQMFLANKYFNDQEPWKKKNDVKRLNTIIYTSLELNKKNFNIIISSYSRKFFKSIKYF